MEDLSVKRRSPNSRWRPGPLVLSLVAGLLLAILTLIASVWGSLYALSFTQEYFAWPRERNWRLLAYILAAWLSLAPAIAAVCMPLGFHIRRAGWLFGGLAGFVAASVWLVIFDWSEGRPSVLYYAEIGGLISLSALLASLGGSIRGRPPNDRR